MSWTPNIDQTLIRSGPYRIGMGAAGSELELGDTTELVVNISYSVNEIGCGNLHGKETIRDAVISGVRVTGTFNLLQTDEANLDKVYALGTLSAGATSKEVELNGKTIGGAALRAIAARIVFHKYSESTLTVLTQAIVLNKGIIFPDGDMQLDGEDNMTQPCRFIAFMDDSEDIVAFGINAT